MRGPGVDAATARADRPVDAYPVRAAFGREYPMTRRMIRGILDSSLPHGPGGLYDYLERVPLDADDFMAACRRLGLEHLLVDVTDSEADAELEARRARGAPPTDREAPFLLDDEGDREFADAMLDVYERKVAEAEAEAEAGAALEGARPAS